MSVEFCNEKILRLSEETTVVLSCVNVGSTSSNLPTLRHAVDDGVQLNPA